MYISISYICIYTLIKLYASLTQVFILQIYDFCCEICDKHIIINRKSKYLKSKSHIKVSKCDRIILSLKDVDIGEIDEVYSVY